MACEADQFAKRASAGDEDGNLAFMDSIAAAAAEPRSYAEADLPWSLQVRSKRAPMACVWLVCYTNSMRGLVDI